MEIPLPLLPPPPGAHPAPPSSTPSMFRPGACPWRPPPLHIGFPDYSTQACLAHCLKALGGHLLPLQI
ncbi:hypothetical protein HU200_026392 [Digitaria exilis]|uniref:Uncharacterized protein n=1 Tax=Digitaria exilis TaxID=1010633 RepID=A0A835BV29_9POAL|nr:hypothetical protein HU200_026392 [Digitaria exilis]CAB3464372.1 unnamed protein product [Digitaria exilis]